MDNNSSTDRDFLLKVGVLVIGAACLVFLLLTPRKELNKPVQTAEQKREPGNANVILDTIPELNAWLEAGEGNEKDSLLSAAIDAYIGEDKIDAAALLALDAAQSDSSSLFDKIRAGELARKAGLLANEPAKRNMFFEKSIATLTQARSIAPFNERVLIELGLVYVESGLGSEGPMQGIMLIQQVIDSNPKAERAHLELAKLSLYKTRDLPKAKVRLKHLLEEIPENDEAHILLAELYLAEGKIDSALLQLNYIQQETLNTELKEKFNVLLQQVKK